MGNCCQGTKSSSASVLEPQRAGTLLEKPAAGQTIKTESSVNDVLWVNDAWPCSPNADATNVNNGVLTVWDKNNPEVTNYCAGSNWRVDGNYLLEIDQAESGSFKVSATVDFSNATGKDYAINCNMYLCGDHSASGGWTYGDAYNVDKNNEKHSELDLFETGDKTSQGVPVLMQITSHNNSGDQAFTYVGFDSYIPPASSASGYIKSLSTKAVATEKMTLEWTVSSTDNLQLKIVQGALEETLDLGYVVLDYSSFKYSSISCGVNNDFIPPSALAVSQPRGFWTMTDLLVTNAQTTANAVNWSGGGAGSVQLIAGESW